ncbi:hypothetical protein [Methanosarcina barkeri]|nr:hypothetical protein [Methanosarcina barkeri]
MSEQSERNGTVLPRRDSESETEPSFRDGTRKVKPNRPSETGLGK